MQQILPNLSHLLDLVATHPARQWGWRIDPVLKKKTTKWHNGVDLSCATGTPIYAPWRGFISKIYRNHKLNGNAFKLRHPDHPTVLETAYVHLDAFPSQWEGFDPETAAERLWVEPGELIGYVGSTGKSTGPHLHFLIREVRRQKIDGKWRKDVDPIPYLRRSLSSSPASP